MFRFKIVWLVILVTSRKTYNSKDGQWFYLERAKAALSSLMTVPMMIEAAGTTKLAGSRSLTRSSLSRSLKPIASTDRQLARGSSCPALPFLWRGPPRPHSSQASAAPGPASAPSPPRQERLSNFSNRSNQIRALPTCCDRSDWSFDESRNNLRVDSFGDFAEFSYLSRCHEFNIKLDKKKRRERIYSS